jgi:hypothetical protein
MAVVFLTTFSSLNVGPGRRTMVREEGDLERVGGGKWPDAIQPLATLATLDFRTCRER